MYYSYGQQTMIYKQKRGKSAALVNQCVRYLSYWKLKCFAEIGCLIRIFIFKPSY